MSAKSEWFICFTTEWQTVNYYSTIHALELIYFNSNTLETMKKQLYPSDSSNFPPFFSAKKSRQITDCNAGVYMYFLCLLCTKMTLHHLRSRKHGLLEGSCHKTVTIFVTLFCPLNCCRIEHSSLPLPIQARCVRIHDISTMKMK